MLSPNAILAVIAEQVPIGGIGYSWPIPQIEAGALRAIVLVYRRSASARSHDVYPPHEALVVDPETGKLLARRPRPLGAVDLDKPLRAASPRPKLNPEAWRAAKVRFNDLAPRVWAAYAARSTDKALRPALNDYRAQLTTIELPEIEPLHALVGKDFHDWMKRINEAP